MFSSIQGRARFRFFLFTFLFAGVWLPLSAQDIEKKLGEAPFTPEDEKASDLTLYRSEDYPNVKPAIDLSRYVPPATSQLPIGACWAFATAYAMRSFMDNYNMKPNFFLRGDGSPDLTKIYSPEFPYQIEKGNVENCDFGQQSFRMLQKMLDVTGSVKYADFPFSRKCNNQPKPALKSSALDHLRHGYKVLMVHDVFSIKKILSDSLPMIVALRIDDYFHKSAMPHIPGNEFTPLWDSFGKFDGDHAMLVVGYNDTINAFKVLNSWGSNWGNNGYCWIGYNIINSSLMYACYPAEDKSEKLSLVTPTSTKDKRSGSSWPTVIQDLSTWVKTGYYRIFNDIRIGLSGLSKKGDFATIDIRDSDGKLIRRFFVDTKTSKEFYVGDQQYVFTLDAIDRAGWDRHFSWAAYFTISKKK
jgi:hypothetical protein